MIDFDLYQVADTQTHGEPNLGMNAVNLGDHYNDSSNTACGAGDRILIYAAMAGNDAAINKLIGLCHRNLGTNWVQRLKARGVPSVIVHSLARAAYAQKDRRKSNRLQDRNRNYGAIDGLDMVGPLFKPERQDPVINHGNRSLHLSAISDHVNRYRYDYEHDNDRV
tara:strand:- start:2119 stop:2616 length:498 start_codon:yes stop_codon:yes gene_type:complete